MPEPPPEGHGPSEEEFRSRLQDALGDLLDAEDSARVERLCADVLASLTGKSVADRLREERGVEPGPPVDLEPGGETQEDQTLLERMRDLSAGGGRYRVMDEVARGGMGVILRVWDRELRRTLAMKVAGSDSGLAAATEEVALDSGLVSRFLEEAQVTGQLDHPGVVPIHELGLDDHGRVYFTMRLVKGRTLKDVYTDVRAGEGEWTRERALGALLRVCEAVAYAHAKGVVHRDLKPANVMVGRFGEVYVMDWGLAKVVGRPDTRDLRWKDLSQTRSVHTDPREGSEGLDDSPLVTMDGAVMGTPTYMSPEQGRGDVEHLDARSDVYALGAMLYELLAGRAPYVPADGRATPRTVLLALLDGPPRPLEEVAPDAPAELAAICEKAMARDADARYRDVIELSEDLRAFLEGRVVHAYRTGAWAELLKWVARNRRLAGALAAVLVVALCGLGAVAWTAERGRAEVLRMADVARIRRYAAETEDLSARPENVEALRAWRARAQVLADQLPVHRAALAELRESAEGADDGELRFDSDEDAWRFETLAALVGELEILAEPDVGLLADIDGRLAIAGEVVAHTLEDPAARWDEARRSIGDPSECPHYGGLQLAPQLGLIPSGRDPGSGLWEFWVYGSGEEPARDGAGWLAQADGDAIVLVLLPGGTFRMGAVHPARAPADAEEGDTREWAVPDEWPVDPVALAPFFFSKFEVTQAQWRRLTGRAPSDYDFASAQQDPGLGAVFTPRNPVESVSWVAARRGLLRLGLDLPTEAQWEYAARGGGREPWPWGDDPLAGEHRANLASMELIQVIGWEFYPYLAWEFHPTPPKNNDAMEYASFVLDRREYYDESALHAPVGSYPANAYGVHDLGGNVSEWCRDLSASTYDEPARPGDGLRDGPLRASRVVRGGCWARSAYLARSARRGSQGETAGLSRIGVRAVRALER